MLARTAMSSPKMRTCLSPSVLSKANFDALLRPSMVEEVDAAAARDMIACGAATRNR
jgi:hypothetical protein